MDIHSLSQSSSSLYFQEPFIAFLEQHLSYIKEQGLTAITLNETNAYKHEGNFYGILNELNIPVQYHHICMRVNDLRNSNHYSGINTIIHIPEFDTVEQLKNQYITFTK